MKFIVVGYSNANGTGSVTPLTEPGNQSDVLKIFAKVKPGKEFPEGILRVELCKLEVLDIAIDSTPPLLNPSPQKNLKRKSKI